jgi:hypothetical protein
VFPLGCTPLTIAAAGPVVVAGKKAQELHAAAAAEEHQVSIATLQEWERQLAAREDTLNRREAVIAAREQELEIATRRGAPATRWKERCGARRERPGRRTRDPPMQWQAI